MTKAQEMLEIWKSVHTATKQDLVDVCELMDCDMVEHKQGVTLRFEDSSTIVVTWDDCAPRVTPDDNDSI